MERWRVWIEQVNATYVDVIAKDYDKAIDKAILKWRRECARALVTYVLKIEPTTPGAGKKAKR